MADQVAYFITTSRRRLATRLQYQEKIYGKIFARIEIEKMTMYLKLQNRAVNKVHLNTRCLRWLKGCVLSVLVGICYLQPMSLCAEGQLVSQKIYYRMPEACEVFLVWGINGWQTVPEVIQLPETAINDKVMHTPMIHKDDIFCTKINVIKGTTIDFCFLIKSIQDSIYKKLLLDVGYHLIVSQDTTIHVTHNIIKQKKRHISNGLKLGFKLLIGAIIVGGIGLIIFRFVRVPLQVKKVLLIIMINGVAFIFIIFAGEMYFRLRISNVCKDVFQSAS